jgi:hypothetical protein
MVITKVADALALSRRHGIQHHPIRTSRPLTPASPRRVPFTDISNLPPLAQPSRTDEPNDPIPTKFRDWIRYDQKYNVFICRKCKYKINGTTFCSSSGHLYREHDHQWSSKERNTLWKAVKHLPGAKNHNLPKVPNDSPPIEGLKEPVLGTYSPSPFS